MLDVYGCSMSPYLSATAENDARILVKYETQRQTDDVLIPAYKCFRDLMDVLLNHA